MSDKMKLKTYECREYHKMTTGYPALYRNKCIECRPEIGEQSDHVQAKTIKSKLQSVVRFMHIFVGLNRQDMSDLTQQGKESSKNTPRAPCKEEPSNS